MILKDGGRVILNERLEPLPLQDEAIGASHAQRLPGGGYALAWPRAMPGDNNLHLFDAEARYRTKFPIGDGIKHMVVDRKGRIWVGYFDEGTGGYDPLSRYGLSRFDQNGRLEYRWDAEKFGWIIDCYALTLEGADQAWVYAYADHFLATVMDEKVSMVLSRTPVSLISGVVVGHDTVGLLGGYDFLDASDAPFVGWRVDPPHTDRMEFPRVKDPEPIIKDSVVTILDLRTKERTQVQVLDETGSPLSFRHRATCRGNNAVCWTEKSIYRFTLDELKA